MSTMAITWVRTAVSENRGAPDNYITKIIEREAVTTSGTTAASTVCPNGANTAIVTAVDAALLITSGAAPVAAPALGLDCAIAEKVYFLADPGVTKIAGIQR